MKLIKLRNNKSNIKIKHEVDGKNHLYSHCISCGFKTFKTIHKEKLNNLLKSLNYM